MPDQFHTARGFDLIAQATNPLTASLEDYLEMIYRIIKDNDQARVNEIAGLLNVRPSSVSKMLTKLSSMGYINYEKYGAITLTSEGRSVGRYLLSRHDTLISFFEMLLGKGSKQAFIEAELSEHIFEPKTVSRIDWLVRNYSQEIEKKLGT